MAPAKHFCPDQIFVRKQDLKHKRLGTADLKHHTREFSIQGEGDGTAFAVVNQLYAWLFQK
jgi:hypothetical protein